MIGVWILLAALVVTVALALVRRRVDGRFRVAPAPGTNAGAGAEARPELPVFDLAAVGGVPGRDVTLVQFSSAFCAPCRATHRLLTDISARHDGVEHLEIDAESHLDLVREHGILRTPTVLVLDPQARVVGRASGLPTRDQVEAAIAALRV